MSVRYGCANQKFHFLIYRQAQSDILMPLIESLWLRCGPTMYSSLNSPGLSDTSFHLKILDALAKENPRDVEKAMIRDIRKTGDYLIAQAKQHATSGVFADLSGIAIEDMTR